MIHRLSSRRSQLDFDGNTGTKSCLFTFFFIFDDFWGILGVPSQLDNLVLLNAREHDVYFVLWVVMRVGIKYFDRKGLANGGSWPEHEWRS